MKVFLFLFLYHCFILRSQIIPPAATNRTGRTAVVKVLQNPALDAVIDRYCISRLFAGIEILVSLSHIQLSILVVNSVLDPDTA